MLRARLFRRYLFSHLLYSGLTVAIGVLGITLGGYAIAGLASGMAASTGALLVSTADVPSPRGDKFRSMFANWLLAMPVVFVIGYLRHSPAALAVSILVMSFVGGMLTAWGRRAIPHSVAVFIGMAFALATPAGDFNELLHHTRFMLIGGFIYVVYATAMNWALARRTKQQVFADCLHEFAVYLRRKARFFDPSTPLPKVEMVLLQQQAILADKLQSVRDFIFRRLDDDDGWALAAGMLALLDAYEQVLASQTDYEAIRTNFADEPIMLRIREWIESGAEQLLRLSRERMVGISPGPPLDLSREELAVMAELEAMSHRLEGPRAAAFGLLDGLVRKMQAATVSLARLDATYRHKVDRATMPSERELQLFATRPHYSLRPLLRALNRGSPVFRYSVRVALAMVSGFLMAYLLPYASHGYWIVLTIAVTMRGSFSQTKQRRADRMMGTLIGCVLAAIVIRFLAEPAALIGIVFMCLAISHAFAGVRYRYTATAACITALLQLHLLAPGTPFVISERLADTAIGATLAYVFSFVLPNWEARAIPGLAADLRSALMAYVAQALSWSPRDFNYRIARRRMHDALAALSQAGVRMRDEPEEQHVSATTLNTVTTTSHLLYAHLAAVRILLLTRSAELDRAKAEELLQQGRETLLLRLDNHIVPSPLVPAASADAESGDSAELALERRIEQALHDAAPLTGALDDLIMQAHKINEDMGLTSS